MPLHQLSGDLYVSWLSEVLLLKVFDATDNGLVLYGCHVLPCVWTRVHTGLTDVHVWDYLPHVAAELRIYRVSVGSIIALDHSILILNIVREF